MATAKTNIVGPIEMPDGSKPGSGVISFQLNKWDVELGEAVVAGAAESYALDVDGNFSASLWPPESGVNGRLYNVSLHYMVAGLNGAVSKTENLGPISFSGTGPLEIMSLLGQDIEEPTAPSVLALALSAQTVATAAAAEVALIAAEFGDVAGAIDAAELARDKAEDWAENPEDVEVETGQYSAKHHAKKSAASAVLASTSAAASETARDIAYDATLVGPRVYPSWTALAAETFTADQWAYVDDVDTGTHTDPIKAGTVTVYNAGYYKIAADGLGSAQAEWIRGTGLSTKLDSTVLHPTLGFSRSGITFGLFDDDDWLSFWISDEPQLYFGDQTLFDFITEYELYVELSDRSGIAFGFRGEDDYLHPFWGGTDGSINYGTQDVTSLLDGSLQNQVDDLISTISVGPSIRCWGDSLTADLYPSQLATLMGRTVSNGGKGGQDSAQVYGRMGSETVTVQIDGDEIPASGAFTLSANPSPNICYSSSGTQSITGWIAGVHVTMTGTSVSRTEDGDAVSVLATEVFTPDLSAWTDVINVRMAGRNDIWSTDKSDALLERDLRYSRNIKKPLAKEIVLGVINWPTEPIGTDNYDYIRSANEKLRDEHGVAFIDIHQILVNHGLAIAGLTATAADEVNISQGIIPESLRDSPTDGHLNIYGNMVVALTVQAIIEFMEAHIWL